MEIDEKGHLDRDENKEEERENKIKKTLGNEFVTINLDTKKLMFLLRLARYMTALMKLKKKETVN